MRKYRGLTKEGKWVYGWYLEKEDSHYNTYSVIVFGRHFEVIPETVGQSIGLKDKNAKESYDGDKISFGPTRPVYLVKWSICNAGFYLESMDEQKERLVIANLTVGEINGDIHTTPNLMEQE